MTKSPVHVAVAADGPDAMVRGIAALGQLRAGWDVSATIVHVCRSRAAARERRRTRWSHAAQASGADAVTHVVLDGDEPAASLADFCESAGVDLLLAPGTAPRGLRRLWPDSFRARLTVRCALPLWTTGGGASLDRLQRPAAHVACLLALGDPPESQLMLASRVAASAGARLSVFGEIPDIDDGTPAHLMDADVPLTLRDVRTRVAAAAAGSRCPPSAIAAGTRGPELRAWLRDSDPDILLVSRRQAAAFPWGGWFHDGVARLAGSMICVDPGATGLADWPFRKAALSPRGTQRPSPQRHAPPAFEPA